MKISHVLGTLAKLFIYLNMSDNHYIFINLRESSHIVYEKCRY